MSRLTAVISLMERHRELALEYNNLAQKHLTISKELECYRYELTRPGFKTKGWHRRCASARIEPYLVQAHEKTVDPT